MVDSIEKLMLDAQIYWNREGGWVEKNSHWRGSSRTPVKRWEKIGLHHRAKFDRMLTFLGKDPNDYRSMIEWGCGGGLNVAAFADHFEYIYGVDISGASLHECDRQAVRLGFSDRFWPFPITCSNPHFILSELYVETLPRRNEHEHYPHIGKKVDFILSTACFQHFPSKGYGSNVLCLLCTALRPGGLAIIQIRMDDGGSFHAPKDHDYCGGRNRNAIRFTSYKIGEFYHLAWMAGFGDVGLLDVEEANYVFFFLEKMP